MTVSGGCMTQHTTNPEHVELNKCKAGPSSIPACFISLLFAKKYVGSCTELPAPVLTMDAPIPRYNPRIPSVLYIFRTPSMEFKYLCCVPTGKKGEYDCNRVLMRKKGLPAIAPRIPDAAPEKTFTPKL